MKNYVQPGEVLSFTAGADIDSGDLVFIGSLAAVAVGDVANGDDGEAKTCGVFSLPKVSAQAWSAGDRIYYDASLAKLTNVKDSDCKYVGIASEDAANPSSTGKVLLNVGYPQSAAVTFSAGSNLVGVDGTASNAAPLVGTETRLDALDTAVLAIIAAMKASDQMAD